MTSNLKRRGLTTLTVSSVLSALLIAGSLATTGHTEEDTRPVAPAAAVSGGFADLIERVEPSVVTIEVSKTAGTQLSGFNGDPRAEEFFRRFFDFRAPGPVEPHKARGVGSGFIVDDAGYIVTNHHVIADADSVTVRLSDEREFEAEVVGFDDRTDLALLKIEADELTASSLGDSDSSRVGDWVVAIGNPFGLGGTATVGIVSARGRDIRSGPYDDYLQIDAPINRGNSGGPVFNTAGEVVGVNTAIYSPNGGSVGIGFAIPSNMVQDIVLQLKDHGAVDRGWLGVQLQGISEPLADSLGLASRQGALVAEVVPDSPAARAGIEAGDVIVGFEAGDVKDARDLSRKVGSSSSGETIELRVWRDQQLLDKEVTLGEVANAMASADSGQELDDLGLALAELTDELRQRLGLDEKVEGVVVAGVDPRGKAAKHGIRRGDVLIQVDRQSVSKPKDLEKALVRAKKDGKTSVPVLVRRGDRQQFSTLPVA